MKVWTVTTDTDDGLSSTVEFTEAAADQAALEIVQDWAERYDLGPEAPDNWRELLHMIQGLDCHDSLVVEEQDISHHPDLVKPSIQQQIPVSQYMKLLELQDSVMTPDRFNRNGFAFDTMVPGTILDAILEIIPALKG